MTNLTDVFLVADDNEDELENVADALGRLYAELPQELEVVSALDGDEAVEQFRRLVREVRDSFRLAIVDLNMNSMDGDEVFELCSSIDPTIADRRFVLRTSHDEVGARRFFSENDRKGFPPYHLQKRFQDFKTLQEEIELILSASTAV